MCQMCQRQECRAVVMSDCPLPGSSKIGDCEDDPEDQIRVRAEPSLVFPIVDVSHFGKAIR